MGDAIIALTTNMAARRGTPIEFKKNGSTFTATRRPEGVGPDQNVGSSWAQEVREPLCDELFAGLLAAVHRLAQTLKLVFEPF